MSVSHHRWGTRQNANGFACWTHRFFFYSGDGDEPPHIHVERDSDTAKFWLEPVRYQRSWGFSRHELNRIQRLVEENSEQLLRSWNEYFSD